VSLAWSLVVGLASCSSNDTGQEIFDLYSPWSTRGNLVVFPPPWQADTLPEKALSLLGYGLYFLGIAALVFILGLLFQAQALPIWLQRGIIIAFCLATFLFYVGYKRSYANFDLTRVYGDTITYARVAQIPLTSRYFWFSDRAFTLPLLYKAAGVTSINYLESEVKRKVADIQTWISILAWTFFGLAVAANVQKKWLAPVSFALVLFFGLSLDISVWTESVFRVNLLLRSCLTPGAVDQQGKSVCSPTLPWLEIPLPVRGDLDNSPVLLYAGYQSLFHLDRGAGLCFGNPAQATSAGKSHLLWIVLRRSIWTIFLSKSDHPPWQPLADPHL
jgi:hypothetical protein